MSAHRFFRFLPVLFVLFLLGAAPAFGAMDASILPAPDAAGQWGYVDAVTGETLIPPRFSQADFFYDGVAIVNRAYPEEAYSVTTRDGRTLRRVPEKEGIIAANGKEILPPLYVVKRANSDMSSPRQGVFIPRLFLVEGGEGESLVLHADKGVIVPAGRHERIRFTAEGGVFCDGVYYTPEGATLFPPSGCAVAFAERETGMFRVREKGDAMDALEGVIRPDGTVLVPVKYHSIAAMPGEGVWLASRRDASLRAKAVVAMLTGDGPDIENDEDILTVDVYDASGTVLRSFRAHDIPDTSGENYIYTSKGREYRVNARTGETAPEKKKPASAADTAGNRAGRAAGPELAPGDRIDSFNAAGQAILYCADGTRGVMDRAGKRVLPCEFTDIFDDSRVFAKTGKPLPEDALYRVRRGKLWGLYDGAGRERVPCRYGFLDTPGEEWVRVEAVGDRNKNGLVNFRTGQVVPPQYTSVRALPGFFLAYLHGDETPDGHEAHVLLDAKGRETARYGRAEWFEEPGVLAARLREQGGRRLYALLDGTGKALTPFQYTNIAQADGPFVWGRLGNGRVLLDGTGREYRILPGGPASPEKK